MLKRNYLAIYRVRPNKSTEGVRHALKLTFNGRLRGNPENMNKVARTLTAIHRVNSDAIIIERIKFVGFKFAMREWLSGLFDGLLLRLARRGR